MLFLDFPSSRISDDALINLPAIAIANSQARTITTLYRELLTSGSRTGIGFTRSP